ncbi:hypothetical protein GIB67_027682 [Kingdonia uniflora]|uniref:Uncharacterized protein n=1 Tax=Kingdonia uniflora TaxID=39325 RepID=A0A7J7NLP3_9MAGN|nr:hypothetical protein GIB67_027682 [Kingdonia uniflora]
MHMLADDPHPSTLPRFRVTRDPEQAVTWSRSGRKKKRVEFKDLQQPILNPPEENYSMRFIAQLPYGVTHIYYTGKELTYWFYEYCKVGHRILKEDVKFSAYSRLIAWERRNWKKTNDQANNLFMLESARNAQKMQELTDEVATLGRHLNNVDDQLYAHDLHLRRGRDVWVVPLPPGGGARMMQRGSGPRTRAGVLATGGGVLEMILTRLSRYKCF